MKLLQAGILAAVLLQGCSQQPTDGASQVDGIGSNFSAYNTITTKPTIARQLVPGKKKPALVYYAVDTEEPFFQDTVDYEVRQLRSVCNSALTNTNWIVFLNSWAVYDNLQYMKCVDGHLSRGNLDAKVQGLIDTVSSPTYDNAHPTAGLKIPLRHDQQYNHYFKTYPLAHPEVLWAILDFTTSSVFTPDQYSLVLNLKSHGSDQLLLAGLTDDERQQKTSVQMTAINGLLDRLRHPAAGVTISNDQKNRVACVAENGIWVNSTCQCSATSSMFDPLQLSCNRALGSVGQSPVLPDEIGYSALGLGSVHPNLQAIASSLGRDGLGGDGLGGDGLGGNGLGGNGLGGNGLGGNGLGGNGLGGNGLGGNGLGGNGLGGNGLGGNGLGGNGLGGNGLGGNGLGGNGLGGNGLGGNGLGVDVINGLSIDPVSAGLNVASHFGTPDDAMMTVLQALDARNVTVDFLMFESCDSNVNAKPEVHSVLTSLNNINEYYSAQGAMWYRSLDLQSVFRLTNAYDLDHREAKVIEVLDAMTSAVQNFVPR